MIANFILFVKKFFNLFDSQSVLLSSDFGRIPHRLLFVNHFFRGFFNFFSAVPAEAFTSATALLEYQSCPQKSTPFYPVCILFYSLFLFSHIFPISRYYTLMYLIPDISCIYRNIGFYKALSSFLPVSVVFRFFQIAQHKAYTAIHSSKQRIKPFFRVLHSLSPDPFHDDTGRS